MIPIGMLKQNFILKWHKKAGIFFVVFYLIGIIGFLVPYTLPVFTRLIPFAILLSFAGLLPFHLPKGNGKTMWIFMGIYLLGFFIEAVGTNTGIIFGSYWYGNSWGVKILETPVLIGINWLFLVYITASLWEETNLHTVLKIILAAIVMLGYDIILEQVAPKTSMWFWENNRVPVQNYLSWFILSLLFHSAIKILKIKIVNPLSLLLLSCQLLFLVTLAIFLK